MRFVSDVHEREISITSDSLSSCQPCESEFIFSASTLRVEVLASDQIGNMEFLANSNQIFFSYLRTRLGVRGIANFNLAITEPGDVWGPAVGLTRMIASGSEFQVSSDG